MTNLNQQVKPEHRAVSPVIGVILMVAITVILAAVIGAFVLEIGDQQETAPSTSFESSESVKTYLGVDDGLGPCIGGCETNLSQVTVTHMGGDTIDISQLDATVDGNASVYGNPQGADQYTNTPAGAPNPDDPTLVPVPNTFEIRGTNDVVEFESGDSLEVISYKGLRTENVDPNEISNRRLTWALRDRGNGWYCDEEDTGRVDGNSLDHSVETHNPTVYVYWDDAYSGACSDDLDQGNDVGLVWTATSGGKTQTLFEYTVQQSNANH
jgi:flagellin-like protein